MTAGIRPVAWLGDSLERLRSFAKAVRQQVGFELDTIQHGEEPSDWKPLSIVGPGAREIRIHAEGEHRVIYVAKFQSAVYVLHAFSKKSQRTPRTAIALARTRYQEALRMEGITK